MLPVQTLPQTSDYLVEENMQSVSVQASFSPTERNLMISKLAIIDVPPSNLIKPIPEEDQGYWMSKMEQIQLELIEAEKGFREMISLKDEHIQILTEQLRSLPAQIMQQFQQFQRP